MFYKRFEFVIISRPQ